jgi:hypothetical protein
MNLVKTKPTAFNTRYHFILIFLLILISGPLFSQGFLHRSGKYLYDGNGNEVILRGIGTGNWMLQEGYMMQTSGIAGTQHEFRAKLIQTIGEVKTDSFYTAWLNSHFRRIDVDSMKSWGFNSVRVAMHYKWLTLPVEKEPVSGENTWLETGFQLIDSLLDWCSDNQMYLILDLHGAPGGQGKETNISDYDPSKPSLWESQANKNKTIALWRKLAERYSDEPWIGGYDLINETNWTFPEGNNSKLKELMVNITKAIREVDKNHLIIIEGNGFANDFSGLTPAWDINMAYSFHKYWNYNTQESINFAINLRNNQNVPIWLGETGENSNTWFTELVALCEENKIGWSWWPVKKPSINNPLKVTVNSDYTKLINYWKGTAPNPGVDAAFTAVLQFAENHRLENCSFQKDVVDALIRQPFSTACIPYKVYKTGEPVFAVDYNLGRNRLAYFDNDTSDFHGSTDIFINWNQGWSYRNDGVDIEACTDTSANNGYNVGWITANEWMEYTVDVDSTAAYKLTFRSASGSSGSKVRVLANGVNVTPAVSLAGTSGWQRWQTSTVNDVILQKGRNLVRLMFDQGGSNLNYFMFSDPTEISSVPFKALYAETSADGSEIYLSINKPVSTSGEITNKGFSVTINNNVIEIDSIDSTNEGKTLVLHLQEAMYYGGTIRLSVSDSEIFSGTQKLEDFSNLIVTNKLPVRYNVPGKIQAENYYYNNGMVSETCTDAGGGQNMGYANPNDYMDYLVNITKAGYYNINYRVASTNSSSQIIIRKSSGDSFVPIDTVAIPNTGGWQTWRTVTSKVYLEEGRFTLRVFVRSGEFNINWFEGVAAPVTGIEDLNTSSLQVFPNPADEQITVITSAEKSINGRILIFNSQGSMVKNVQTNGESSIRINLSDLTSGMYFLKLESGSKSATTRIVIKRNNQ